MPYDWTSNASANEHAELRLWPHQSLPPKGFAAFILATFTLITLPLYPLLGTVLVWALLPFLLLAVAGVWFALSRSYRDRQILEVLTLTSDHAHLVRTNPKGDTQEWDCNRYWARPELHEAGGPVPFYVTLQGAGRTVEIGRFLSEDERKSLYDELVRAFAR